MSDVIEAKVTNAVREILYNWKVTNNERNPVKCRLCGRKYQLTSRTIPEKETPEKQWILHFHQKSEGYDQVALCFEPAAPRHEPFKAFFTATIPSMQYLTLIGQFVYDGVGFESMKNVIQSANQMTCDSACNQLEVTLIICNITEITYSQSTITDNNLLSTVKSMFNGRSSDVVVKTMEKEFSCHKAILTSSSDFFRAMFQHDTKENQDGVVDLRGILTAEEVEDLLLFIYMDKVPMDQRRREKLQKIANMYQIVNHESIQKIIKIRKKYLEVDDLRHDYFQQKEHYLQQLEEEHYFQQQIEEHYLQLQEEEHDLSMYLQQQEEEHYMYLQQPQEEEHYLQQQVEEEHYLLQQQEEEHCLQQQEEEEHFLQQQLEEERFMHHQEDEHLMYQQEEEHYLQQQEEEEHYLHQQEEEHYLHQQEEEHYLQQQEEEIYSCSMEN